MQKILLLFTAVVFSLSLSAQIDFSGAWKLNSSKSKLGDQFNWAPKEVIIVQSGNDLSVEKHSEWQGHEFTTKDKFTLDGKGNVNPGMMDNTWKSSVAVRADDKKSLKILTIIPMQDSGEIVLVEVYKLDRGNMVIEMTITSSFGDMAETQVYDKK